MYTTFIGSDVVLQMYPKKLLYYAPLHVLKSLVEEWTDRFDMFHNTWCLFYGLFYKSMMHIWEKGTVFVHVFMIIESQFYSNICYLYVVYLQWIEILCTV